MNLAARISRLGTETAFDVLARANALASQGQSIINLGIGQPDFQTPQNIVEAGIKALRDGHHGYTAANGIPALRETVAMDIHKRIGAEINPDNVVIVPGGKPTIFFAALIYGEAGKEIMYPNPGFPIYESAIRFSGATPVPIALEESQGFSFSAEKVLSQITERTSLIIINSPANPTAGIIEKSELDMFVAGLENFPNVTILSDEIYSRMLYDGRQHQSLMAYPEIRDRLILLDGWSKTYAMTGWRIGYGVWPDQALDAALRLCINDHSCVNAPTQYAAIEALTGSQAPVDTMMAEFDKRRKIIVEGLNAIEGMRCVDPAGAFYAFPNIEATGLSSREAQDQFLNETGVATVAGTSFGDWGKGYLRFSYANSTENIEEALARIKKYLSR